MYSDAQGTFKEWYNSTVAVVDGNDSWKRIGGWAFPNKKNTYSEVFFHLCPMSWQRDRDGKSNGVDQMNGETCFACGEKVPDGMKMIGLLEKL